MMVRSVADLVLRRQSPYQFSIIRGANRSAAIRLSVKKNSRA